MDKKETPTDKSNQKKPPITPVTKKIPEPDGEGRKAKENWFKRRHGGGPRP